MVLAGLQSCRHLTNDEGLSSLSAPPYLFVSQRDFVLVHVTFDAPPELSSLRYPVVSLSDSGIT